MPRKLTRVALYSVTRKVEENPETLREVLLSEHALAMDEEFTTAPCEPDPNARPQGLYYVHLNGKWDVAFWAPVVATWYVPGLSRAFTDIDFEALGNAVPLPKDAPVKPKPAQPPVDPDFVGSQPIDLPQSRALKHQAKLLRTLAAREPKK